MPKGTVKFFNDQKGFGFISRDGQEDLFVRFSNIIGSGRRTLVDGQEVEFEVGEGRKGPEAVDVNCLTDPETCLRGNPKDRLRVRPLGGPFHMWVPCGCGADRLSPCGHIRYR